MYVTSRSSCSPLVPVEGSWSADCFHNIDGLLRRPQHGEHWAYSDPFPRLSGIQNTLPFKEEGKCHLDSKCHWSSVNMTTLIYRRRCKPSIEVEIHNLEYIFDKLTPIVRNRKYKHFINLNVFLCTWCCPLLQYFIGVTVLAMVPELPEIVNGIQFALQNNISLRLVLVHSAVVV